MRTKLEIADVVTSAMHLAREQKDDEGVLLAQRLLARIAEDRFNLVVVGLFNRGKSSLMNAVLGVDRLPVGVLPLTSVVTTVSYGSRERLLLQREGWSIPQEEPISNISEYVTETGNPGNEKKVRRAEVQMPAEILRRGFYFIDTPGIGSALLQNTATTQEFLPEADAIIFVTSFEFPFTDTERQFFRNVRRHVRKIFLVANKADLVSERDRDEVLNFLRACVEKEADNTDLKIFAVSARDGLTAKMGNRPELIAASGLAELERSLIEFMTTEKSREFLVRLLDRADRLLQRQKAEVRLRKKSHEDPEFAAGRLRELDKSIDALLKVQSEISHILYQRIAIELPKKLEPRLNAAIAEAQAAASQQIRHFLPGLKLFDPSSTLDDLENKAGSVCSRMLSESLLRADAHFERTIRELGGDDLQRLCKLPERVNEMWDELLGLARDRQPDIEEKNRLQSSWSAFLGEPQLAWVAPPVCWLYRIPIPAIREYVLRKCFQRVAEALHTYQQATLESAATQARAWLENLAREVKIRINTRALKLKDVLQDLTKPADLTDIDSLLERLEAVRNALHDWGPEHNRTEPGSDRPFRNPARKEPCVICSKSLKTLFDFLSGYQYELATKHASNTGFCPLHTWHYAKVASPQGICFAYAPALSALSQKLRSISLSRHSGATVGKAVLNLMPERSHCPACKVVRSAEETAADTLVVKLSTEMTADTIVPLCLPHLALILDKMPEDRIKNLLQDQAELLERAAEDMRGYALKHHAIRRALFTEDEIHAVSRGLIHAAGSPGLSAPWDENGF
jgi:GTP-binding protein EngB required for normal cell division